MTPQQEAAALWNFAPAYDRLGSIASEIIGTMRRPMSASSRKQTKYYAPLSVCFVPKAAHAPQQTTSFLRAHALARGGFTGLAW